LFEFTYCGQKVKRQAELSMQLLYTHQFSRNVENSELNSIPLLAKCSLHRLKAVPMLILVSIRSLYGDPYALTRVFEDKPQSSCVVTGTRLIK
jgi:hypothetical protein